MKKLMFIALSACLLLCGCTGGGEVSQTVSENVSEAESETVFVPKPLDGAQLVVFGDSITALGSWGKTAAKNCNMKFFNGAKGGITTAQGLDRFDAYVTARNPDYVTLCFGMNDLIMVATDTPRVTPEQFGKNLTEMVNRIRELNAVPLLLTTNPLNVDMFYVSQSQDPAMYGGRDILEWLDTYNQVTRDVAKATGAYLVDTRTACDKYKPFQVVTSDGIHLSATGNKVFADTLTAFLQENFERDSSAPAVSYDNSVLLKAGESASLAPADKALWFTEPNTMSVYDTNGLILANTNNLWPDAQCTYLEGIKVPVEGTTLKVKLSTANVNTAITLYLDGAYPHAYVNGQYFNLHPHFDCSFSEVGDMAANQQVEMEIPLTELDIPAYSIRDGYVVFSGIKVYAAGTSGQPVTITELTVTVNGN